MTDRLRIVQVGDVAHVAPAIADALAPHADVFNVPLRQVAARLSGPVKVLTAPMRIADAMRVARDVRRLRPDVVHVHWVPNGVIGPMVRRPWVLHAHGDDIRDLNVWRRLAFAPLIRAADAVVVSTPDLVDFAPAGAAFVPTPIPRLGGTRRPELWDVLVISAARDEKGSPVAFDALRRLAVRRPGLRMAAHDGPAYEEGPWERLAPTSKLEFQGRLAAARVVLGQFAIGALGIADLESMALGRPLLTWLREGLYPDPPPLFSSRDPEELAERAVALLDSDAERETIGSAGADWVRRTHAPDAIAAQLLAIYRRLLG